MDNASTALFGSVVLRLLAFDPRVFMRGPLFGLGGECGAAAAGLSRIATWRASSAPLTFSPGSGNTSLGKRCLFSIQAAVYLPSVCLFMRVCAWVHVYCVNV